MNPMFNAMTTAQDEDVQFMDHFGQLPSAAQRVIIGIALIAVLAALVVLRDMIKSQSATRHEEELAG